MKPTQEQLNDPAWWDDNAPEGYDYAYTTGPKWSKSNIQSLIGTVQFADSEGYQKDNEQLCLRDDCWVLLAKRPTKPAFVPEVGVECEGFATDCEGNWNWRKVELLKEISSGEFACLVEDKLLRFVDTFRPIKSERELLVDIIKNHGNIDSLADSILEAGFSLKEPTK